MIKTTTARLVFTDGSEGFIWFVVPDGMSAEQAFETQEQHGPFTTEAEVAEDQRITLLGPQCEVTEGGMWDPAWDRPQ